MSDQHEVRGYYTGDIHNQYVEEHHDPRARKIIWRTFWILLFVTIFEVGIALTSISKDILLWVFVILTIVKAGYIVMVFMHLKNEKLPLKYAILLPFMLILYLIAIVIAEGNYLNFVDKLFG